MEEPSFLVVLNPLARGLTSFLFFDFLFPMISIRFQRYFSCLDADQELAEV